MLDDAEPTQDEIDAQEATDRCGLTESGSCLLAGTEYCDLVCPYNR